MSTQRQQEYIDLEDKHGAHNYHPLPVVLESGHGCNLKDVDGKEYLDFLSAYSAVNQGHSNSKIVDAMVNQARRLDLTSRAFYNDQLGSAEEALTTTFKYDKALFMNTGVEAVESALKLCRRWAYEVKKVPSNKAVIITAVDNFHGRTLGVISFSTDPESYGGFGPYLPGFVKVKYGDVDAMKQAIAEVGAEHLAGILLEPIQGEAGIVVPPEGYLKSVEGLCRDNNALLIIDEIQTGLGRTGDLLCHYHDGIRPDIVCLGKALGGGIYPVSAVLADNDVMLTIKPGQHGSTYGGNPIACAVAKAALSIVLDDNLANNARELGAIFEQELKAIQQEFPHVIASIRGRGLLWGVVIDSKYSAWQLCLQMKEMGLLAKPTHDHIIRFAPPLVINEATLKHAVDIIRKAVGAVKAN